MWGAHGPLHVRTGGNSPSHGSPILPAPERIAEEDECRDNEGSYMRLLKIPDTRLLTSQNSSEPSGPVAPRCIIQYPHQREPQGLWVIPYHGGCLYHQVRQPVEV